MKFLFKLIIFIIPVSFISAFYILLTNNNDYPGADYTVSEVPFFELKNLEDIETVTPDNLEGDFILNVWASWCITCLIEHPYLMYLNNNGITVIGLNYKDDKEDALSWLKKYGNPYKKIVHDYKGTLALDLGVTGAPETFLVSDGEIIVHYQGEVNKLIWEDIFLPIINERKMF